MSKMMRRAKLTNVGLLLPAASSAGGGAMQLLLVDGASMQAPTLGEGADGMLCCSLLSLLSLLCVS